MLNTEFSPRPSFTEEEARAVSGLLLSNRVNYWTGQECRAFEQEFAAWTGVSHAVALANGTLALDVALKALGVGPGDEVIVDAAIVHRLDVLRRQRGRDSRVRRRGPGHPEPARPIPSPPR